MTFRVHNRFPELAGYRSPSMPPWNSPEAALANPAGVPVWVETHLRQNLAQRRESCLKIVQRPYLARLPTIC